MGLRFLAIFLLGAAALANDGKDAHLVIVDGNPLEDISALYRVEHMIKGRKMYFAPDMLRAQGLVPFGAKAAQ